MSDSDEYDKVTIVFFLILLLLYGFVFINYLIKYLLITFQSLCYSQNA